MGANRALIIGSDKDYCYVIKEFLESKGVIVSLILDYNQGIDKLFYENSDITILEIISSHRISSYLLGKVRSSLDFQIIDNISDSNIAFESEKKPVFLLEETSQLNTLLAYLNTFLINNYQQAEVKKVEGSFNKEVNLKSYPYPILLSYIYKNKISCVLEIHSRVELRVYFENGIPVFAEAGGIETALGRMLMDKGTIKDVNEYEKMQIMANEKGQKLGEVLVSMKVISPHELNNMLQKQIVEKLIRGFDLHEGDFKLHVEGGLLNDISKYDVNFPQFIYEGIRRYVKTDLLKHFFYDGDMPRKLSSDKSMIQKSQNLGLGPKDLRIIQDLEKYNDLDKLIRNSTTGKDEILRILFLTYLMGIIEVENAPYSNIDRVFSNIMKNKAYVTGNQSEEIINLEEEIPDEASDTVIMSHERKDVKSDLDQSSRNETGTGLDTTGNIKKSNVISFIEQQSINDTLNRGSTENDDDLTVEDNRNESNMRDKLDKTEVVNSFNALFDDVDDKNHYEILGVSKDASVKEIKSAYYDLVRKYHPDLLSSIDRSISEKADRIFARITVAHQTLTDENQRAQYDASFELEMLKSQAGVMYQAEVAYNDGLALLKQKQYDQAITRFNKAVEINPGNLVYSSLISWASFLKDRDNGDNIKRSISVFERAISQDPSNPDNYYYLGSVYKHMDDLVKAEINFSKAVEHDPDFIDAKRELRIIKNRKTERKNAKNLKTDKRFWSGIFKK